MNMITREIEGTKEEFLAFLKERADIEWRSYRSETLTKISRQHSRGYAEGVEFAMAAIRDWKLPGGEDDDSNE